MGDNRIILPRDERTCLFCKKLFVVRNTSNKKFCCKTCYYKSLVGRKIPSLKGHQPRLGMKNSKEHRNKISKANKGIKSFRKGKHIVKREMRICPVCRESFEVRITSIKKYCSKNCSSISGKNIGCKHKKHKPTSDKTKQKLRIARIKQIEQNNGICWPNYNKNACDFFKMFDIINCTKGQYAVYGDGEYHIKELGYFLDYINFERKLIMEYDEKYHEKQKEKDAIREKEIKEFYSDFEFIRIKEDKKNKYNYCEKFLIKDI